MPTLFATDCTSRVSRNTQARVDSLRLMVESLERFVPDYKLIVITDEDMDFGSNDKIVEKRMDPLDGQYSSSIHAYANISTEDNHLIWIECGTVLCDNFIEKIEGDFVSTQGYLDDDIEKMEIIGTFTLIHSKDLLSDKLWRLSHDVIASGIESFTTIRDFIKKTIDTSKLLIDIDCLEHLHHLKLHDDIPHLISKKSLFKVSACWTPPDMLSKIMDNIQFSTLFRTVEIPFTFPCTGYPGVFSITINPRKGTLKKTIKKNANGDELCKKLTQTMEIDMYRNTIENSHNNILWGKHIIKGWDVSADGSYRCNHIDGIRLDSLTVPLPIVKWSDMVGILSAVDELILTVQVAGNAMPGDWGMHNLIYSPTHIRIFNINLKGFYAYPLLPEWGNAEWLLNSLRSIVFNLNSLSH